MPPPFFPLSQDDILAFFLHVAEAVDLPVMFYNFSELCGKRIDLATIAACADRAPMCAIKQSGGEFAYRRELIAIGREKKFVVMSGSDTRLPEVFKLGAASPIGGLVNIVPELMALIDRVCRQGQPGDATNAANVMKEIGPIIDQLTFPLNVAAGREARGFNPGVPKTVVSPDSRALYAKIVVELVALFKNHHVRSHPPREHKISPPPHARMTSSKPRASWTTTSAPPSSPPSAKVPPRPDAARNPRRAGTCRCRVRGQHDKEVPSRGRRVERVTCASHRAGGYDATSVGGVLKVVSGSGSRQVQTS